MEKSHKKRVSNQLKEFAKKIDWIGLDNPNTFNADNLCNFEDVNNLRIIIFSIGEEPRYKVGCNGFGWQVEFANNSCEHCLRRSRLLGVGGV